MSRRVIGYFEDNGQAHQALRELKNKGFQEISILANEKGDETGNRDIGTSSSNLSNAAMINGALGAGRAGLGRRGYGSPGYRTDTRPWPPGDDCRRCDHRALPAP